MVPCWALWVLYGLDLEAVVLHIQSQCFSVQLVGAHLVMHISITHCAPFFPQLPAEVVVYISYIEREALRTSGHGEKLELTNPHRISVISS